MNDSDVDNSEGLHQRHGHEKQSLEVVFLFFVNLRGSAPTSYVHEPHRLKCRLICTVLQILFDYGRLNDVITLCDDLL